MCAHFRIQMSRRTSHTVKNSLLCFFNLSGTNCSSTSFSMCTTSLLELYTKDFVESSCWNNWNRLFQNKKTQRQKNDTNTETLFLLFLSHSSALPSFFLLRKPKIGVTVDIIFGGFNRRIHHLSTFAYELFHVDHLFSWVVPIPSLQQKHLDIYDRWMGKRWGRLVLKYEPDGLFVLISSRILLAFSKYPCSPRPFAFLNIALVLFSFLWRA